MPQEPDKYLLTAAGKDNAILASLIWRYCKKRKITWGAYAHRLNITLADLFALGLYEPPTAEFEYIFMAHKLHMPRALVYTIIGEISK